MVAKIFLVATLVVAAVALADLVAHPEGTKAITNAYLKAQTGALNAELGKTS